MSPEYDVNKDYLAILGISPSATKLDIRKAYLNLSRSYFRQAKTFNADKDQDSAKQATAIFNDIQEAWKVLRNPKLKYAYAKHRSLALLKACTARLEARYGRRYIEGETDVATLDNSNKEENASDTESHTSVASLGEDCTHSQQEADKIDNSVVQAMCRYCKAGAHEFLGCDLEGCSCDYCERM